MPIGIRPSALRQIKADAHVRLPAGVPFDRFSGGVHTHLIACRERQGDMQKPERFNRFDVIWRNSMKASDLTTFSAADATTRFAELLDAALRQPVGITTDGRLTAYLVSKNTFEAMLERLEELEDQLWTLRATAARKDGFAEPDEVDALLCRLRNNEHENVKINGALQGAPE